MKNCRFDTRHINNVLIRSTNWVGDAIITTPAVRAISKQLPHCNITILAKPWVAPVFENSPYIDEIMIYDANGRHAGLSGKLQLIKDIRARRFDLTILLQNAIEAGLLTFMAGIPRRFGYTTDGRGILLTDRVYRDPEIKKVHQIHYYLAILKAAGFKPQGFELELFITDEERKAISDKLKAQNVPSDAMIVGINPGATFGSAKRWFADRYAGLCRKLIKTYQAHILIFGGPGEEGLGQQIEDEIGGHCTNFCGKTTLREVMGLISHCNMFVTNDSGLMHVGAALNISMLAVFGPTDHIATGPYSDNSRIVRFPIECSPCLKPECPLKHHRCMKELTVDKVYDAVVDMIGS